MIRIICMEVTTSIFISCLDDNFKIKSTYFSLIIIFALMGLSNGIIFLHLLDQNCFFIFNWTSKRSVSHVHHQLSSLCALSFLISIYYLPRNSSTSFLSVNYIKITVENSPIKSQIIRIIFNIRNSLLIIKIITIPFLIFIQRVKLNLLQYPLY